MHIVGVLCSIAAALFWAIAVILFKICGSKIPPTALNLFKGVVTLALMVPTMWIAGVPLFPACPPGDWLRLCLSGILGITLADTFFFMSLNLLGAGYLAIIECIYLPSVIGLSFFFLGESVGIKGIAGAILVILGILAGSYQGKRIDCSRGALFSGLALGVFSVGLIAVSIVMVKPILAQSNVLWTSFTRQIAGVAGLLIVSALHPRRREIMGVLKPSPAWKQAFPGAVMGNYLAMIAWIAGFKYTLVSVAAILNQLSMIFTFILAAFFLKEPVTQQRLAAIVLAVSGAVLASQV